MHLARQGGEVQRRRDHGREQHAAEPHGPLRAHGCTLPPGIGMVGTTYVGRKSARPRAMDSATPGTMRSSSVRSFTATLEISTAIAGAAVVRNCRTGAVCNVSGEPLKRFDNSCCTRSTILPLKLRKGDYPPSPGVSQVIC